MKNRRLETDHKKKTVYLNDPSLQQLDLFGQPFLTQDTEPSPVLVELDPQQ